MAQDANYNITALFDTSGNLVERYAYDPYGVATILAPDWSERPASLFAWQHLHQGLRFDPLTGLYHNRAREYSPTLMRFASTDPIGFQDSTNIYAYVSGNPTAFTDPLGTTKGGKQNKRPSFVKGNETPEQLAELMEDLLKDPKKNAESIKQLKGWMKIKKAWTRYAQKFGKKLPFIGAGVSLLLFADDTQARGVGRATVNATPVLSDIVGVIDEMEDFEEDLKRAEASALNAINSPVYHAAAKASKAIVEWADYELSTRACPCPDSVKITACIRRYYNDLYFAFMREKKVELRPKLFGFAYDVVVKDMPAADITPFALQFQKCLDDACGIRK